MALATGASDHAGSLFERALTLYETAGETHAAARASSLLAMVDARAGRSEEGLERMERAYAVIADDEPDADLAFLLARLGGAHFFVGDPQRAAERVEQALDVSEALGLPEVLVTGWNVKGLIVSPRRPQEAAGLFQLALDTALAHELHETAGVLLGNLSDLGFRRDRYGDSLGYLEQQLGLARRIGNRGVEWFALTEMTYALTMLGRWDEALARFSEIPDGSVGVDINMIGLLNSVLEIHLHQGELDQARRLLARHEGFEKSGDVQAEGVYQAAVAAVRLAEGGAHEALQAAERAMSQRSTLGIASQEVKHGFRYALEAAFERAQEFGVEPRRVAGLDQLGSGAGERSRALAPSAAALLRGMRIEPWIPIVVRERSKTRNGERHE